MTDKIEGMDKQKIKRTRRTYRRFGALGFVTGGVAIGFGLGIVAVAWLGTLYLATLHNFLLVGVMNLVALAFLVGFALIALGYWALGKG